MPRIGIHFPIDHPRIHYLISYLDAHPLCRAAGISFAGNNALTENTWNIGYGVAPVHTEPDFVLPAQNCLFGNGAEGSSFHANSYGYAGREVFSVEVEKQETPRPLLTGRHFQFDLLETLFFHISRFEEVFCRQEERGESGWLREELHFLVQHRLEKRPVVDQLIAVFLHAVTGRELNAASTYDLSHDIDFLYRYPSSLAALKAMAGSVRRREGLAAVLRHPVQLLAIARGKAKDPYDRFDLLLSEARGWTQKTLYLMAGGETSYDNHYRISDPKIAALCLQARQAGYAIGLHPSYNAAFKPALWLTERDALQNAVDARIERSRQHWLRFDWRITPAILNQAGIAEDASLGYRRHLGFRCGTGFPYQLYNFSTEAPYTWRERPLACMDSAAIHEAARSAAGPAELLDAFFRQNALGTHISINFHNSNFDPGLPAGPALEAFYRNKVLSLPA